MNRSSYSLCFPWRSEKLSSRHFMMTMDTKVVTPKTSLIKQRFYWPAMDSDIQQFVRQCNRCILRKTRQDKSAGLVNIVSTAPIEIICLDYHSLERSKGGVENVLVITDHFSRYTQAIPTRNQTARRRARVLIDNFIVHYGFPARIRSDQGQIFESNLIVSSVQSLEWKSQGQHPTTQ